MAKPTNPAECLNQEGHVKEHLHIEPDIVIPQIIAFIQSQIAAFERDGAILGMSGGIDSALVASLLVRALGADKVLALLLPERDSSPDSKTDALREIDRLGISYREVVLTPMLSALGIYKLLPLQFLGLQAIKNGVVRRAHQDQARSLGETPFRAGLLGTAHMSRGKDTINAGNAYARVKHRTRMLTLYYFADLENRLVVGTTNKSEAMTGFVVKWGDNVADIEPILPFYKTQVRQLAAALGVSQEIMDKAPTPDLMPGITDEIALGVDYATLDQVLWGLERGWDAERISAGCGASLAVIAHVQEMSRRSHHLRHMPPSPEL